MKRLFSAWLLCILAIGLVFISTVESSAQKVLDERLPEKCVTELSNNTNNLLNDGKFANIFNIQAQLPFVPAECSIDKGTEKDPSGTTALPVRFFPFVLLRVYKFLITLAFYLFGLGLIITGVLIQTSAISSNYEYARRIKTYLNNSIKGIATVLFAYYIVYTILWVFNADSILKEEIIKIKS